MAGLVLKAVDNRKRKPVTVSGATSLDWAVISTLAQPPTPKRRRPDSRYHRHTEDQWEQNREIIQRLYCQEETPLEDVVSIMSTLYGFDASLSRYRSKLKEWEMYRYNKLSPNQLVWIAREIVGRAGTERSSPSFRLKGSKLNSRNLERTLNRAWCEDTFDVTSLLSHITKGDLSGYTSSTKGVKVSWLTRLALKPRVPIEAIEEPKLLPTFGKCIVQIVGRNQLPFDHANEERAKVLRSLYPDLFSAMGWEDLKREQLWLSRGESFGTSVAIKGVLNLPKEMINTLGYLHTSTVFLHGEACSAFLVDDVFADELLEHRQPLLNPSKSDRFSIECVWCGFATEITSSWYYLGNHGKTPKPCWESHDDMKSLITAHREFNGSLQSDSDPLRLYLKGWSVRYIVDLMINENPELLSSPEEEEVSGHTDNKFSLSEFISSKLWKS